MYRDVLDITPSGHIDKPTYLNDLGNSFVTRFEHFGELNGLEGAISTLRDAVDLSWSPSKAQLPSQPWKCLHHSF